MNLGTNLSLVGGVLRNKVYTPHHKKKNHLQTGLPEFVHVSLQVVNIHRAGSGAFERLVASDLGEYISNADAKVSVSQLRFVGVCGTDGGCDGVGAVREKAGGRAMIAAC